MVKIKGSKDGDILTAQFKGQAKSLFPSLKKTKSLVLLSIRGNPYCTEQYLKAIIEKATSEFEFTTFLIADEVYWHNLCHDFKDPPINQLQDEATALGQAYFEEHLEYFLTPLGLNINDFDSHLIEQFPLDKKTALNKTATNFEVVYWRDWLTKSSNYVEINTQIMDLYHTEPTLAESVHRVAADFSRRHANEQESKELLMLRSSKYLIEESPAVMWIAASLGYNFVVYPGEQIPSFAATRDYFIKKEPTNNPLCIQHDTPHLLINWLEVSFLRSRSSDRATKNVIPGTKENIAELMKGVTEGIFNQNLAQEEKIRLITEIMVSYQKKKENNTIE